ncbi:N-acetylneuraminate synthase [Enterobacter ludwigii]
MITIIAEAGVNHNGSESLAHELVDAAWKAGADIIKFQTFRSASLVTDAAPQADYQTLNTGKQESQQAMLSRLELSCDAHRRLISHCEALGITFLSTAFDDESLTFLVDDLGLGTLKIASGELSNAPFILRHARSGCKLIVSTGMATLAEVEAALGVIAFGMTQPHDTSPGMEAFMAAYNSVEGQTALRNNVTLLHCTTEYPTPMEDINLKAMDTLAQAFGLPVGYSDHSEGLTIPIAAAARGACLIEKHFTLDKTMAGPDHKASLEPAELVAMVKGIRDTESAMGNGIKGPRPSEQKNKAVARKSLVAACEIAPGDVLDIYNVAIKRPGIGMSPYSYWDILGKRACFAYQKGDLIRE